MTNTKMQTKYADAVRHLDYAVEQLDQYVSVYDTREDRKMIVATVFEILAKEGLRFNSVAIETANPRHIGKVYALFVEPDYRDSMK